ncbi:MAG: TonB-dependent receptor [Gemmatimonadota bacterium]
MSRRAATVLRAASLLVSMLLAFTPLGVAAQGVTTSAMSGFVLAQDGQPLEGATVTAVHVPSGTRYTTLVRSGGAFSIPNMRIGGPYTVTVDMIGYRPGSEQNVFLRLAQTERVDFSLIAQAVQLEGIDVEGVRGEIFDSDRTGASTVLDLDDVTQLPSVRRSTRDLVRLDPRNDGNFAFAGRNWLYNNISLDGSYYNNPFGLDDPAPGGQAGSEPVPFDAVEQVQVSVAPFDVREGGFTGANVNTVTKSGTNLFRASAYSFFRNEDLIGTEVSGSPVIANPDLSFNQSGFTLSGPIVKDKAFFFINAELERRDDPGTNFTADEDGNVVFGESRAEADVLNQISQRMQQVFNYDTGPFQGFVHETNSNKVLAKLDWNLSDNHNLTLRYNFLDAERDLPPHPFVLSFANAGRGPNPTTLPFQNAGYTINNELHSVAFELNSRGTGFANRFFASFNRFRDFREANSEPFPTVEIGEDGVGYTTVGHEPFSIHNILDQDVLQLTNNLTFFQGRHSLTLGSNFEWFGFFNSFNIFRHGVFFLPDELDFLGGTTFDSLEEFFEKTDPNSPDFIDLNSYIGTGPFKGENIDVGQLSFYAQDEFLASENFTLNVGVRVDLPMYFTDPVANPYSTGLTALDENDELEVVDQASLPGTSPLWSPRLGFNWDVSGDNTTQLRGGSGIFTGRVPFVWVGNVISNPGANPNLWAPGNPDVEQIETDPTRGRSILQQSFDLNAMDPDFEWPQVWVTDVAIDQDLGDGWIGTAELIYGNDINAIFMRNADLIAPVRTLDDGRPYFGGFDNNELNQLFPEEGAGIYVIDNTNEGWNVNVTGQLRKTWDSGLNTQVSYSFTDARNNLKSSEIASVLFSNQPVQGDPNTPELSFAEFNQRHRVVGAATYSLNWSPSYATHFGLFFEAAEGNQFTAGGGNRYSFTYSGDVNGDGFGGNDLIFIPASMSEIRFDPAADGRTAAQQWAELDAFIEQDSYLSENRGQIAERFGLVNPWYHTVDLRILQDLTTFSGGNAHTLQLNVDILNVTNLLNSDWGVRKLASPAATSPLTLTRFDDADGEPVFNFTGPSETFIDDPSQFSRWQIQVGLKYLFN